MPRPYLSWRKKDLINWAVSLVWPALRARANTVVLKQISDLIDQISDQLLNKWPGKPLSDLIGQQDYMDVGGRFQFI